MLRLGKQKKTFITILNLVEITVSRVKVRLLSYKVGLFASGLKRCLRILCTFLRSSVKELGYFKMVSSLRLRISRFLMQHAHLSNAPLSVSVDLYSLHLSPLLQYPSRHCFGLWRANTLCARSLGQNLDCPSRARISARCSPQCGLRGGRSHCYT